MHDPLWRDVYTGHTLSRSILGIPVRFETNHTSILSAIDAHFAPWPGSVVGAADSCAVVRVVMHDGAGREDRDESLWYRMPHRHRLLVCSGPNVGVAEIDRGEAFGYVTEAFVSGGGLDFSVGFLEALTLALATYRDRCPVHAATIGRDGVGLLLVGRSGTGKSSVAYAARRMGLDVYGEDVAYVQLDPRVQVWPKPGPHRLSVDVAQGFPELAALRPVRVPNGKSKVIVPMEHRLVRPLAKVAPVVLMRGDGDVEVEPLDTASIVTSLLEHDEVGFDLMAERGSEVAARLAMCGGWCIRLSHDPEAAANALDALLRQVSAAGGHAPGAP